MSPSEEPAPLVLRPRGTHLYPGATGDIEGEVAAGPCLVDFSDGSAALASLAQILGGEALLTVSHHVTARGTRIEAKTWRLSLSGGDAPTGFRVMARA